MEDMHVETGMESLDLDILAQTERLNRLYTQLTLCFPVRDASPGFRADVIDNLERALAQLSKELPWTSGKVIQDGDVFKIAHAKTVLSLVVKELGDDDTVPTWDELEQANFPFRMLDEDVIAPCKTMVEPEAERPVLMIQANFVKGGLLLTFNAQHGSMDMAGQAQVVTLLAKACRGEEFTKDEVEIGNAQRTGRIPVSDQQWPVEAANPEQQDVVEDVKPQPTTPLHALVWEYFDFLASSLSSLKEAATQTLNKWNHIFPEFVSTDDVLTAFIWQSITRARQPRLDHTWKTVTELTRNVDVRRYFDLPSTYPGFMVTSTRGYCPVEDIITHRPLGVIASGLRAVLSPWWLKMDAESQARIITRNRGAEAKKNTVGLGDPRFDIKLSSWAKEKMYDLDFGPCLGKPEAVRRPKFGNGSREGLVYFLPKGRDGSIVVGICLREEDMGRLRTDAEVLRWATWIG